MQYQEFLCAVESELNKKLKGGVRAGIYIVEKNNNSEKAGIQITAKGTNVAPVVYLEKSFSRALQGEGLDKIVEEILDFYKETIEEKNWDCRQFQEYGDIEDKIVFKLINREKNTTFLQSVPSIDMLDLSIVFYILLESDKAGTVGMQIHDQHMSMWDVRVEEVYKAALKNVSRLLPAEFFTMRYAIEKMLHVEQDERENLLQTEEEGKEDTMFVLTNSLRNYGAACLAYPYVRDMIGVLLKQDYYILPSSVHEVIIVPASQALDIDEMSKMVKEINETQVSPEEVLSDHAYFYERKGGHLLLERKKY